MSSVITEREVKVLQFDQIRQRLAQLTSTPLAEKKAMEITPSSDYSEVLEAQNKTSEGRLLCRKNLFLPSRVVDIEPYIFRADKGSLLAGNELSAVMLFLKAAKRWVVFFKDSDNRDLFPLLSEMAGQLNTCPSLASALERSIDEDGNVLDGASSLLSSLRRQKLSLQNKIRDKLDEYLRNSNFRRYLQDNLVTIRGDRFVLPVKQEYRQNVQGVVHDQSASGATLFIEPLPVVQMQNDLITLQRQEEQEIERILYQLASDVASFKPELTANQVVYTELDLTVAKGKFSLTGECNQPELKNESNYTIKLIDAFHPLLEGEKIPLSVELGEKVRTLVLTGPNTGGKTVALKTIGLLIIMSQCGFHIPAAKETSISVFKKIRADIGDEQSIAQSLSTFSGHMKNIIETVENARPGSLVLLDELGAGTDPSEGAALAMAILDELTVQGALTVATTHINELKLFAQVQELMQNAAMEFNPDTLTPTYKLLQGVPGQSNAFYIAERLGLGPNVIEKAKNFVHRSHDQVESVIASLVEDQQRYERDSRKAALDRNRAEVMMEELEKEKTLLRARRDDILNEAREEARQILKGAKDSADRLLKELRSMKAEGAELSLARAEQLRRDINTIYSGANYFDREGKDAIAIRAEDLSIGLQVYVPSLRQKGEIIAFSKDEAHLQVGSIKVQLPLEDLQKLDEKYKDKKKGSDHKGGYSVEKDLSITSSIDLRGLNFGEARPLVEKLIDDALLAGLKRIDLIHGKGTGKLKKALQDYLKGHALVDDYRSGAPAEGGDGVTVVRIK